MLTPLFTTKELKAWTQEEKTMEKIETLIELQKNLFDQRDAAQKEAGEIGQKINELIVEELFKLGFAGSFWYLSEEDVFIYSEHKEKIVLDYKDPASDKIKALLKKYNKEYLPIEPGAILRMSVSGGQPWMKFDLNVKPKEFIKKHGLKVVDTKTQQEIERLQRIRDDWLS